MAHARDALPSHVPPVPDWRRGDQEWVRDLSAWQRILDAECEERVAVGHHPKTASFGARLAVLGLAFPHVELPIRLGMTMLEELLTRVHAGTADQELTEGGIAEEGPLVRTLVVAVATISGGIDVSFAREVLRWFSGWLGELGEETGRQIERGEDFNFTLFIFLSELRTGERCPPIRGDAFDQVIAASRAVRSRSDLDEQARKTIFRNTLTSMLHGVNGHPSLARLGTLAAQGLRRSTGVHVDSESARAELLTAIYESGHDRPIVSRHGPSLTSHHELRDRQKGIKRRRARGERSDPLPDMRSLDPEELEAYLDAAAIRTFRDESVTAEAAAADAVRRTTIDPRERAYLDHVVEGLTWEAAAKRHGVTAKQARGAAKRVRQRIEERNLKKT